MDSDLKPATRCSCTIEVYQLTCHYKAWHQMQLNVTCHWQGFGMSLQAIDLLWSLCSQNSLLMLIYICSHSSELTSLPQLYIISSSGIRFSQGACNVDPSYAQFTAVFALLWEWFVLGSGCKYSWSFACLPLSYCVAWYQLPRGLGTPDL